VVAGSSGRYGRFACDERTGWRRLTVVLLLGTASEALARTATVYEGYSSRIGEVRGAGVSGGGAAGGAALLLLL
jgi:hypothetical protein